MGGWNREQDSDSKGQCGIAKELHKTLAKQLTLESGEEITRTMSHLPTKEDTRHPHPLPTLVSAACA